MAESDFDRESVDRAFADLVAGYHLTAERPTESHAGAELTATEFIAGELTVGELTATDDPPSDLRSRPTVTPEPTALSADEALGWRVSSPAPAPGDDSYVPAPLPPLARPGLPSLIGWTAVLAAALVVLVAGFGLDLPAWVGWLAVGSFIGGFVILLTQLPRHRPPDAGDGAVL